MFWLIRERRSASLCSTTSSFACMVFFYAYSGQSEIDVFLVFATPDFLFRYHCVELLGSVIYISFQWCVANFGNLLVDFGEKSKKRCKILLLFQFYFLRVIIVSPEFELVDFHSGAFTVPAMVSGLEHVKCLLRPGQKPEVKSSYSRCTLHFYRSTQFGLIC